MRKHKCGCMKRATRRVTGGLGWSTFLYDKRRQAIEFAIFVQNQERSININAHTECSIFQIFDGDVFVGELRMLHAVSDGIPCGRIDVIVLLMLLNRNRNGRLF